MSERTPAASMTYAGETSAELAGRLARTLRRVADACDAAAAKGAEVVELSGGLFREAYEGGVIYDMSEDCPFDGEAAIGIVEFRRIPARAPRDAIVVDPRDWSVDGE